MRQLLLAATAAALLAPAAQATTTNIVPGNWLSITANGNIGVLRAGSPWGPGSTATNISAPVDGTRQPENTQWNNGSFWWDQDPSVNRNQVTWELQLNKKFSINQLKIQADDNDSYLVEYWNGSGWQSIFNVPTVFTFGLVTRDSGTFGTIHTDRFRFTATGGDDYYALSQFEAYGAVPEPASWALLIAGFGLVGAASRRRRVTVSA
jgi:hypothetical protein